MIPGRGALGWQTIVADLALILFMITASTQRGDPPRLEKSVEVPLPAVAKWRADQTGPTFQQWIADLPVDPRATLVIRASYSDSRREETWAIAQARATEAKTRFTRVRTELVESRDTTISAVIVYDGQQIA